MIILALTGIQISVNAKKKNRVRQLISVIAAVIYAVCGIGYCLIFEARLIRFLEEIWNLIPFQLPPQVEDLLNIASTGVIFNLVLYAGYAVFRIVPGAAAKILSIKRIPFQKAVGIFYRYDTEYRQWFIREKWINLRELFRAFCWCGAGACGLILGAMWYLQVEKNISIMIFPVAAHLVIVEFFGFINGYTKEEFEHAVGGEDSHAQKISNYYKVREVYEKIFPREVLVSYTSSEYAAAGSTLDLLESLRRGDREEAIVSHFFTLGETEEMYDNDCILATKELMKGENVVFFNPFYRDLGKYIVLPVMDTLLKGRKCLIVVGRNSAKADMKDWMDTLLWETSKIRSMWRVDNLSFKMPECEVGIMGFDQLYDAAVLEANGNFLKQVRFVIILEASLMLNTGQVGLSILASQMADCGERPAYCILDRMTDGLVDTMSHLLQSEITKVAAPPVSRNIHTGIGWDADGDYLRQKLFGKQTRFLGNGVELAAVAVKNQVQEVNWFAERKAPVKDIKWIAGQFFSTLCQYMNLPIEQQSIYNKIHFVSNIWSVPEKKEQFLIAEDEFMNLFSTMRTFLSRGREQTFVNILSENYLLRDYMRCNQRLFRSNPNAIPSLVPDYAKTERNTLIKLLLLMSYDSVTETKIRAELKLLGIETDDVLHELNILLSKYTDADSTVFTIRTVTYDEEGTSLKDENIYSITAEKFEEFFGEDLKNAYYICENEESETQYIDAKLFGHVVQTLLPGQMVTYDGKYYIAKYVASGNGVVLRRASNLYDGRKYYRQIRAYDFGKRAESGLISSRTVMDIEMTKFRTDFSVMTTGYLELNRNDDLRSARVVDFAKDPSVGAYTRKYHNKAVLRIRLPETTEALQFTISFLLMEIFRSIFPEGWPYIAVLCRKPEHVEGMLNYMLYDISGDVEDDCLYIVEDSNLDLGLLEAIEKNFILFMEILTDFICWHFEKMKEAPAKDPRTYTAEFPEMDVKKRKKFTKFAKALQRIFRTKEEELEIGDVEKIERKKRQKPVRTSAGVTETEAAENAGTAAGAHTERNVQTDTETGEWTGDGEYIEASEAADAGKEAQGGEETDLNRENGGSEQERAFTPEKRSREFTGKDFAAANDAPPDVAAIDGTDIFETQNPPDNSDYFEECFTELGIVSLKKSRYQEECFLKFGFEEIDKRIRLEEVKQYLTVRGFSNNALTKARHRDGLEPTLIDLEAVNHCDFCGIPINGVSYERLTDGRVRCNDCSMTAINSAEEFKKIFFQVLEMMQNFYGIEYRTPIIVKTADAKAIARGAGAVYVPSTEVTARVLGYAQRKGNIFNLMVENGSPRLATIETMAHEMTHIWQYLNWDDRAIRAQYPEDWKRDIVYEGMAVWAAVQYLYLIGEYSYAMQQEELQARREDIYGVGFKLYRDKFPLIKDSSLVGYSPFSIFPPL